MPATHRLPLGSNKHELIAASIRSSRVPGVISGLDVARETFRVLDTAVTFEAVVNDGDQVAARHKLRRMIRQPTNNRIRPVMVDRIVFVDEI